MPAGSPPSARPPSFVDTYGDFPPEVRCVSVFGPANSGKTTYFASIYGMATGHDAVVEFEQGPTADYLQILWDEYVNAVGGFPTATGKINPVCLSLNLTKKESGCKWRMAAIDYSGELIQKARRDDLEFLRESVELWLRESEAILVFLDMFEGRPEEGLARRDEVMKLLEILREAGGGTIRHPLGLVLTKWDSLGTIGEIPGFWGRCDEVHPDEQEACYRDLMEKLIGEEVDRARRRIGQEASFRQIHDFLKNLGVNYSLFPVSAVGPDREPNRNPKHPFNLMKPFLWAAEQADARRLVRAEEEAAKLKPARAAGVYEALLRDGRITDGPVHATALGRIEGYRARVRKARARSALVVLSLAAILAGAGWWTLSGAVARDFDNAASFREKHPGMDAIEARIENTRRLLNSYGPVLDGDRLKDAQRWLADDQQAKVGRDLEAARKKAREEREADWQSLVQMAANAKAFPDVDRYALVVQAAKDFEVKHGPGENASELATIREESDGRRIELLARRAADEAEKLRIMEKDREDADWVALEALSRRAKSSQKPEVHADVVRLADEFRKAHPATARSERLAVIRSESEGQRLALIALAVETDEWRALEGLSRQATTPEMLGQVVRKADEFQKAHPATTRGEALATLRAEAERKMIVLGREKVDFDALIVESNELFRRKDLDLAISRWKDYLRRDPAPPPDFVIRARATLEELEVRHDDETFLNLEEVVAEAKRGTSAEKHVAAARAVEDYRKAGGRKKDPARKLNDGLADSWDRRLYGLVVEKASSFLGEFDVMTFSEAYEAATNYLNVENGLTARRMTKPVARWKQWGIEAMSTKTYNLKLESVFVTSGGLLEADFKPTHEFSVAMEGPRFPKFMKSWNIVNGVADNRAENGGITASFEALPDASRTFSIPYQIGDGGLKVIPKRNYYTYGLLFSEYESPIPINSSSFAPGALTRGVEVADSKSKNIKVKFSCPEAIPPALPRYEK